MSRIEIQRMAVARRLFEEAPDFRKAEIVANFIAARAVAALRVLEVAKYVRCGGESKSTSEFLSSWLDTVATDYAATFGTPAPWVKKEGEE